MKSTFGLILRSGAAPLAFWLMAASGAAQEAPEKGKQLPAAILRKYDADHNGLLSDDEKSAWKADLQRGRSEAQTRRLEQYDANKDGKLDKAEKAAARAGGTPKKPPADAAKRDKHGSREGSTEDDADAAGETEKAAAAKTSRGGK